MPSNHLTTLLAGARRALGAPSGAPLLALGTLALLAGCDNPACVFGGDCTSGDGDLSELCAAADATFPEGGQSLRTGAPTVQSTFPSGTGVHPSAPVGIVFSESIAAGSLSNAFTIELVAGDGLPGAPPVIAQPPALVADGRVALILPTKALPPGDYRIELAESAAVKDLTGDELARPADGVLGTFTVTDTPADEPSVIATWPPADATGQSDVGQVVVVLDRPINSATLTDASFVVTVAGVAPTPDPTATVFTNESGVPDTRVLLWRSADAVGPVPLGTSALVEVTVSPAASPILDAAPMPEPVQTETFSFTTAAVASPISSAIVSMPSDAIGIDALVGPGDLMLEVQLGAGPDGGLAGDRLTVFVFGSCRAGPDEAGGLVVLQRSIPLPADTSLVTLTAADLNLLASAAPPLGRLFDGPLSFAFRLERGNASSVLQVLDVDPDEPGIQDPVQDLERPTLEGFGLEGEETDVFRWDVRDLVVVGRASEPLRFVLVEGGGTDNRPAPGELPPVVGADEDGTFLAAPVRLGLVDPAQLPLAFDVTLYDAALNSAVVAPQPVFVQLGQVGPEDAGAPGSVAVEAFDAVTREPVVGALVLVHQDDMNTITAIPGGTGTTDASGRVTLPRAPVGETIVTVDAEGYDLFSLHEIPTNRVSVPLWPSGSAAAVTGAVTTTETAANSFTLELADARAPAASDPLEPVGVCSQVPFGTGLSCPVSSYPVDAGVLGAVSFLATDPPAASFQFAAQSYLRAFQLELPVDPADPGAVQALTLAVERFLDDPGVPAEDRAIDLDPAAMGHVLTEMQTVGVDFGMLAGAPRVTIEGLVPGLRRTATVGRGVAFEDAGGNTWTVRAAYAGAADGIVDVPGDELGSLVTAGTIEADLLVRHEFVDALGNRAGARPRLSVLPGTVAPLSVPALFPPGAAGGPAGGLSFNLAFENTIPDALGRDGLYSVVLTDGGGRRWRLWHPDLPDADGRIQVHFADVAAAGGTPLQSGTIFVQISAWTLPAGPGDPDLGAFLWSDVPRLHEAFAHFAPFTLQYPN